MILPIRLTGQLGLPGSGVPSFTLDPDTGQIIGGERWPAGAAGVDVATGEPVTAESGGGAGYVNDPTLWDTPGAPFGTPGVLNVSSLRDSRGSQWLRRGSYLTESAFDRWRRAGKPGACLRGMGATFPDGTECTPGSSPFCLTTAQRIEAGIIAGTQAALSPGGSYYGGAPAAGYGQGSGGSVTVSGAANPMAWVFGGLIVVGLVWAVARR